MAIWVNLFNTLFPQHHFLLVFLLCLSRSLGLMFICPIFNSSYTTKYLRALLAMIFALFVVPGQVDKLPESMNLFLYIAFVLKELGVGIVISYIISFPFWVVENCGNIIDIQRGEQFGAMINPLIQAPTSSIAKLMGKAFIAYFVAIHGITFFLNVLFKSFEIISITSFKITSPIANVNFYINLFKTYFTSMIILAMPAVLMMMCLEFVLALISSFVPQLNVTVMSMPIKSMIALLILIFYLDTIFQKVIIDYVLSLKRIF